LTNGPLLIEQIIKLLAGEGFYRQAVAEGLHGKCFAIRDIAVAFASGALRVGQIGAESAL
jgi:hypothetical protein